MRWWTWCPFPAFININTMQGRVRTGWSYKWQHSSLVIVLALGWRLFYGVFWLRLVGGSPTAAGSPWWACPPSPAAAAASPRPPGAAAACWTPPRPWPPPSPPSTLSRHRSSGTPHFYTAFNWWSLVFIQQRGTTFWGSASIKVSGSFKCASISAECSLSASRLAINFSFSVSSCRDSLWTVSIFQQNKTFIKIFFSVFCLL